MKYRVFALFMLVVAATFIAGCTQSTVPAATPAPTVAAVTTAATTVQPAFSLGQAYLNDPGGYTFNSEKDGMTKEFRVDNPSWGFELKIQPLNEDLQYCWFTMDVTNVDSGNTETYGFGRLYSIDRLQLIPMYKTGPYKITMKGNRVKVWLKAAIREP
ncbi:MAG: hypothetical protein M0Q92_02000 [Methanoregula sp.]|jgi:hypothetical protein|nr:hypothetical protein [Methanoregula sp.]